MRAKKTPRIRKTSFILSLRLPATLLCQSQIWPFFFRTTTWSRSWRRPGLPATALIYFSNAPMHPHPFHLDAKIIDKHPLMQRELERQDDDFSLLQSQPDEIHPEVVE